MTRRSFIVLLLLGLVAAPALGAEDDAFPQVKIVGGAEADSPVRIVGGTEVDPPGKYDFMGALVWSGSVSLRCGAALLSNSWLITAAHCYGGALGVDDLEVIVGRHDLGTAAGQRIGIAEVVVHPGFDDVTLENDIALLRLASPATAGAPIPWARESDAAAFDAGTIATVAGWGQTEGQPPGTPAFPDELRETDVPIQSEADCRASYGSEFFAEVMLCAGFPSGGRDSCQGDSGGPMFVWDGGGYLHIGVTSWGEGCGDPGFPGVYTRTASYAGWISEVTGLVAGKSCRGLPATLVGTNGPDVLIGTPGPDVIVGRGGDDEIRGRGGDDVVCAGGGDDTVRGGDGADVILGQRGDDLLIGQAGADVIFGKAGGDELRGGSGNDELKGGVGEDVLHGRGGLDALYGGPGIDTCGFDEPIVVSCEIDP